MAPGMKIVKNNPNISHWDFENGYDDGSHENEYPIRVSDKNDIHFSQIFLSNFEKDFESQCRGFGRGFKLVLTPPGEVVKISSKQFGLYPSRENAVRITPKLVKTSEGLRKYTPIERQCFYQSERRLRFFKFYTQVNCETECLANFTKSECGCVQFSMPSKKFIFSICD